MKKILYLILIIIFLFSCRETKPVYKYLDDNKSFCNKASWEAITYFIDENKNVEKTISKIWYKNNDYRIEIFNSDMSDKQVIIIKDGKFYLFTKDKKVYSYNVNDENVEIFLRKVYVNVGFGKKKKVLKQKDVIYENKKCDVYEYRMYRNINGLLCEANVREWINKKNMIIRAEVDVFRTEFEFAKQKKVVGPFKEIYEVKNHKCYFILSSKLFELPDDYEIIDFKSYYKDQLIKAGKTPEATDAGVVTFNVRKR
ncbi:MAG: hypothetical protein N2114_03380 [Candidatus Goldbacteria bacterium]|nr:hypothetical protein [Candidatus Goldiibacteriota bacterium]